MKVERRPVVGVMGGAQVTEEVYKLAFELGERIAEQGWVLLNGGRDTGVMLASAEGAKRKGGVTIGILPGNEARAANPFIDFAIVTNMGDARNVINVLSSDVVVVLPGKAGTVSEAALALKSARPVIFLAMPINGLLKEYEEAGRLQVAGSIEECIERIKAILASAPDLSES